MSHFRSRVREMYVSASREASVGPLRLDLMLERRAYEDAADYMYANLRGAGLFGTREELWGHVVDALREKSGRAGVFMEFGVYQGYSLNWFASRLPDFHLYAFDSFEGLPEAWTGVFGAPRGTFSMDKKLPRVADPERVTLVPGWFEETLPSFLEREDVPTVDVLHMDADIYSSTKFVLFCLSGRIVPGTLVIFDEYFLTIGWRDHEYRAWAEFIAESGLGYEYIGFAGQQVAIRVI